MFCNYCRARNRDDAVYCRSCGRTIAPASDDNLEKQKSGSVEGELSSAASVSLPRPLEHEPILADTETSEKGHGSGNLNAFVPSMPTGVANPSDGIASPWNYEKMGDEELGQLREAYQ